MYYYFQFYTDQQHALNGGNTRRHLYKSMEDFLDECHHGTSKKYEKLKNYHETAKQEPLDE